MTFDEWVEKYKPIKNECGEIAMLETYGKEYEFVKAQNPLNVWTFCDGGEGGYILNGFNFVNRIGYYVTEIPFDNAKDYIFVNVEDEESDEEDEEE